MIFLTLKMNLKFTWDETKVTYELSDKCYFKWRQIINSVPKTWKKILKENQSDSLNLGLLDHQLLKKNNRTLGFEKMNSKEMYLFRIFYFRQFLIMIPSKVNIPTSRTCFGKNFFSIIFNGKISTHFRVKSL